MILLQQVGLILAATLAFGLAALLFGVATAISYQQQRKGLAGIMAIATVVMLAMGWCIFSPIAWLPLE